jgi:hypothetical protein
MKTIFIILLLAVLIVGCDQNDDPKKDPDWWRGVVPFAMLVVCGIMYKMLNVVQMLMQQQYDKTSEVQNENE